MTANDVLRDSQFGKHVLLRDTRDSDYDDSSVTSYNLWSESNDPEGQAMHHGTLEVKSWADESSTTYPRPGGLVEGAITGRDGQLAMFTHDSRPAHDKVELMDMTKQGRVHAPMMLGVAQNAARQRTGRDLVASDDLSPHSERMVDKLKSKGAIPASHEQVTANNMDFSQPSPSGQGGGLSGIIGGGSGSGWGRHQEDVVPRTEVMTGRATMRQVLNNKQWQPRDETPKPGKGQEPLPGAGSWSPDINPYGRR